MMLLPNYSIVEKMKQLSKFNQTKKNDQIFHDIEIRAARESKPRLLSGAVFSVSIEVCVVFSKRSDVCVLGELLKKPTL